MALKLNLLLLLAGVCLAVPQYNYQPPRPTNLYTAPPPPPPKPPTQLYTAPQASNIRPKTQPAPRPRPPPGPGMEGMPYDFTWGVDDSNSGNSFSHVENSDGQTTQGEYRVLLPDGRTQVVTFYDNGGGFNAEVTYI
ncbi:hypothetical protein Pcinc_009503 [Petrolisthes cinctipes]|uniref:Cuticle protein n=1 Tax=Petrolisthes cinctipes TaxID=88211 RepID=A0AAE1G527_PETCI|nr:hypothetical protein Pcinc_009503 [Petrolisthes cinctipes]